tara:strand:- start:4069 stop:4536 length:468 start_codon:yes stop_codon:yes gene_type:complete
MGGKSSSSNATTSQAFDNRVLNQQEYEIDIDNSIEFDQEIDNSIRNEFEDNSDHSVRNEFEDNSDHSVNNDLGDGAIMTSGDVAISTLDGGAIEDAFDFAENVAGESLTASSAALSQAFSSTAGGVIDAGKELVKYGGIGIAALIIFMIIMNRKK